MSIKILIDLRVNIFHKNGILLFIDDSLIQGIGLNDKLNLIVGVVLSVLSVVGVEEMKNMEKIIQRLEELVRFKIYFNLDK